VIYGDWQLYASATLLYPPMSTTKGSPNDHTQKLNKFEFITSHQCPTYFHDCVTHVSSRLTRYSLQSADSDSFEAPRLRTKFGERAFSYASHMRGTVFQLTFDLHPVFIRSSDFLRLTSSVMHFRLIFCTMPVLFFLTGTLIF
jgi:hypothetical protein